MKELARSGQGGGTGASGATASSTAPFPPATSALPASAAPIGSHDTGDPATTNIFAGYLPPHFTEQTLCELFGAFGPLASVKIMWPRTPEEHARGRLTGFVAFMKREDAEECMSYYKTALVDGADLRVGWGKAVPLPPKPFYVHPKHSGPVETGLPFNAQPRQLSGPLDITTAVVKVCGRVERVGGKGGKGVGEGKGVEEFTHGLTRNTYLHPGHSAARSGNAATDSPNH